MRGSERTYRNPLCLWLEFSANPKVLKKQSFFIQLKLLISYLSPSEDGLPRDESQCFCCRQRNVRACPNKIVNLASQV